jgi:hypothetical protein
MISLSDPYSVLSLLNYVHISLVFKSVAPQRNLNHFAFCFFAVSCLDGRIMQDMQHNACHVTSFSALHVLRQQVTSHCVPVYKHKGVIKDVFLDFNK